MRKGEQKIRGDGVGVGEGEREGAEEERRWGVREMDGGCSCSNGH